MTSGRRQTERELAIQAARRAGALAAERAGRITPQFKGRNDPVTEIDRESQAIIRSMIAKRFPADEFVGEEDPETHPARRSANSADGRTKTVGRRWIVDPIDGTMNFVRGVPFYCVSIGFEEEGELVVGVVFDPSRNELFVAEKGYGAFLNGAPIQVAPTTRLADSMLTVGLPADVGKHPGAIETFDHLSRSCQSIRRLGSAALTLAYVAAGRVDAFWSCSVKCWDSAAGVVLVEAAGGRVCNRSGSSYDPYTPEIIATNGLVHNQLIDTVDDAMNAYAVARSSR